MKQRSSDLATIASVAKILAVVLIATSLFFAREVLIPLALGVLLSFLLSPVVNRLQRLGLSNVPAVICTALLAFVVLAGGFTFLGRELTSLVSDLPTYKHELVSKARGFAGLTTRTGGKLNELVDEVTEAIDGEQAPQAPDRTTWQLLAEKVFPAQSDSEQAVRDGSVRKRPIYVQEVEKGVPLASWAASAGTLLGPLATAGLVSVLALFVLIHRVDLRDRLIAVVSHGDYVTTTEALDEVGKRISRYLMAQSILNVSYGIVLTIGLATIAAVMTNTGTFPNVILWGVLAASLRFVPYIGPIIAAVFPLAIAAAVFPGYGVFVTLLVFIVTLELASNNILEPWLYGSSTGISSVAVIAAAVFWGWLWGPVGLLLSTPMTVCLVVLGRHVPPFKIFSTLLGDEVQITPALLFYQRLLVGDRHRAMELLNEHREGVEDRVIVPALKRIRNDREEDRLSDADAERLFDLADQLVVEFVENSVAAKNVEQDSSDQAAVEAAAVDRNFPDQRSLDQEAAGETSVPRSPPTVIGCCAHHIAEATVLRLLSPSDSTYDLHIIEDDALTDSVVDQVQREKPVAVIIAILPRGGFAQARFLCKNVRAGGYTGPIIVACFGRFKTFDSLFVRFRKSGATFVTTTFIQTKSKLQSLIRRRDPCEHVSESKLPSLIH